MSIKKAIAICATIISIGAYINAPAQEMIEYHATIEYGDTVWDICRRITANDNDVNMNELVYNVMQDNGITDAGNLPIGQEIVIRVPLHKNFFGV